MGDETVSDLKNYFSTHVEIVFQEQIVGLIYASFYRVFDGNYTIPRFLPFHAFKDVGQVFAGLHFN